MGDLFYAGLGTTRDLRGVLVSAARSAGMVAF